MTSASSKPRIHHHIRYSRLNEEWLAFFVEEGIFPEIYFPADEIDRMTPEDLLRLEKDLHRRNLELSLHAPFLDLSPGAFDHKIREVTHHRLSQIMTVAQVLRPTVIDCHPHYDRYRYSGQLDQWIENAAATFEPTVRLAEKKKITLALENVFEEEPTPIERLIDKIGSPHFQACFDNGHFHIFHKVPLKKWWEVLGKKTVLLLINDNHGEKDEHLPLGEGNFPFPAYFNLLKEFDHPMTYTLECHTLPNARKTLRSLRRFLD